MKKFLFALFACIPTLFYGQETTDKWTISVIHPTLENAMNNVGIYPEVATVKLQTSTDRNPYAETYSVERLSMKVKAKEFKQAAKESWGVSHSGVLYVNTGHLTKIDGYVRVWTSGRYMLIFTSAPYDTAKQKELKVPAEILTQHNKAIASNQSAMRTGTAMGGLIGTAIATDIWIKPCLLPIIIDTQTGSAQCFRPEWAAELAQQFPDIPAPTAYSEGYNSLQLMDYFDALNARIENNTH